MVRDRKSPEVRRQEILDAAAALFVARGIDGVSIADIAEHAGIAKGLMYHYFTSKDDLVAVLRDRYLSDWYAHVKRLLNDAADGEPRSTLEGFLTAMYEFHADKVEIHHVLIDPQGGEDEISENVRKLLLDFVRAGVRAGRFSVGKLEPTVDFLLNGLHGILVKYLHEGRSSKRFTSDAMTLVAPLLGI